MPVEVGEGRRHNVRPFVAAIFPDISLLAF